MAARTTPPKPRVSLDRSIERSEFGELFPHPFDASVERNPWFWGSGAGSHSASYRCR